MIASVLFNSSNSPIVLIKLWGLTNSTANLLFICGLLTILNKKNYSFIFLITSLGLANINSILPLSNTFFSIHPPLLAYSSLLIVFNLTKPQLSPWHGLFYLSLAMFLGGFWSTQELNWGGWWNWDVLELGSFIFWIFSVLVFHTNHIMRNKTNQILILVNVNFTFYLLNKTGVGTSIHSFVTSVVLKRNFILLLAIASLIPILANHLNFILLYSCSLIYVYFLEARFFKQFLFILLFIKIIGYSWQKIIHNCFYLIICFFILFNFNNILYTGVSFWKAQWYITTILPKISVKSQELIMLYNSGWRSKPHITFSTTFDSFLSRSVFGSKKWALYNK